MLPILAKKRDAGGVAGILVAEREPDESSKPEEKEYNLEDCARDILSAIKANDHEWLADALKEAFQKLDSEPHEEGPHVEPHSYDAQNQAAGEE